MDSLAQTLLSTLLTPVAFALGVFGVWVLRKQIGDIVMESGVSKVGMTPEGGFSVDFRDLRAFAKKAYSKQHMPPLSSDDLAEIAALLQSFGQFKSLGQLVSGRRILWVDNYPANNSLERDALVRRGIDVQTRRSTEEAMVELLDVEDTPFDLVISDWFRNGEYEGERLARMMISKEIAIPIIFYFFADKPNLFNEIKETATSQLKAVGATSSPRELFRWTFAELAYKTLRTSNLLFLANETGS